LRGSILQGKSGYTLGPQQWGSLEYNLNLNVKFVASASVRGKV